MLNAKTLIRVTVLSVWIAACAIAVAQTTDGPSFRTQPSNDNLLLDVYRSTSLSTVFSDLCKKANVACSGVELLEKDSIPPMVVEGKFLTIVRQLAEGANVNIEYAHETPESSPKLTLLRRFERWQPAIWSQENSADADQAIWIALSRLCRAAGLWPSRRRRFQRSSPNNHSRA